MKKTPLKRKTPMRRARKLAKLPPGKLMPWGKPFSSFEVIDHDGKRIKPRKPLAPVSKKQAPKNAEYAKAKRQWRKGHDGRCEMRYTPPAHAGAMQGIVYAELVPAHRDDSDTSRCIRPADKNPHHMAGRGPNLSRIETFCGLCWPCHQWCHAHAKEARRLGYLINPKTLQPYAP